MNLHPIILMRPLTVLMTNPASVVDVNSGSHEKECIPALDVAGAHLKVKKSATVSSIVGNIY